MHYGFLDESGILEKTAKEGSYFVISVVIVANPAEIKNVMKLARSKAKGKQADCLGSDSHPDVLSGISLTLW